jgi:hypothetical protein
MPFISIIGTAGRKADAPRMSWALWLAMVKRAQELLQTYPKPWHLQSGGAAWADHVAVSLFLSGTADSLTLHLPASFNSASSEFEGSRDAETSNYYHRLFSRHSTGQRNTMEGITKAIKKGAAVTYSQGFFDRNNLVGKCDVLIAFTFGSSNDPKDGGTAHTWHRSSAPIKIHIPLSSL